jgi:glycosyltransferase involved in cell wall biosynthesis
MVRDRLREAAGEVSRRLTVVKGSALGRPSGEATVVSFDLLRRWTGMRSIWRHLFRYSDVTLTTENVDLLTRPLATLLLIRLLSRGHCEVIDDHGATTEVGVRTIGRACVRFLADFLSISRVRTSSKRQLDALRDKPRSSPTAVLSAQRSRPVYVHSTPVWGLISGGSVGHIAGVLNSLDSLVGPPIFLTTSRTPTIRDGVEVHTIRPDRFADFPEIQKVALNSKFLSEAVSLVDRSEPSCVYERYSEFSYVGAMLAREWAVPFVLEYNGSEVWIARNWGRPLANERFALDVEKTSLQAADLVVVVSEVMRVELVKRGIGFGKILVNPNGVDTGRYAPDVDGSAIRARRGLEGRIVIGFIGTFGPWHGAETLAEAFGLLLANRPDFRGWVRLLMIGDGARLEATRQEIATGGVEAETVFAGRTAQEDGPAYLAACDILASPHVPNADGSRFFGSPTKLFEYMAMGRAIVASRLEQIGEVLEDDRTAVLVEPGDAAGLAKALEALVDDPERRARLGAAAREEAVANHTWLDHTRRILDRIDSIGA